MPSLHMEKRLGLHFVIEGSPNHLHFMKFLRDQIFHDFDFHDAHLFLQRSPLSRDFDFVQKLQNPEVCFHFRQNAQIPSPYADLFSSFMKHDDPRFL